MNLELFDMEFQYIIYQMQNNVLHLSVDSIISYSLPFAVEL